MPVSGAAQQHRGHRGERRSSSTLSLCQPGAAVEEERSPGGFSAARLALLLKADWHRMCEISVSC